MNELTIAGLVYDIVGVGLLARALIAKAATLFQLASTRIGANKSLFEALMLQRTDALFGIPALVIGFALQGIGATPLDVTSYVLWLLLVPLLPGIVAYVLVGKWSLPYAGRLFWEFVAKQEAPGIIRTHGDGAKDYAAPARIYSTQFAGN